MHTASQTSTTLHVPVMPLPSKYATDGLSKADQRKTITVGHKPSTPADIIYRRIGEAIKHGSEDKEMIPVDNWDEVSVISDYVNTSRSSGQLESSDNMELDQYMLQSETVVIDGNMSYFIVDTNFILSHLNVLEELRRIGPDYSLRIIIPMEVVHELDGLKLSKQVNSKAGGVSGEVVGKLARWANDWVLSCLASNDPVVRGQAMKQRLDPLSRKDDAILDCCLFFQQEYPCTLQILLSNDKNLCTKALLNDVLTVSYEKTMTAEDIARKVYNENILRFGEIKGAVHIKETEVPIPAAEERLSARDARQIVYDEVLRLARAIVARCMEANYGDDLVLVRGYDKDAMHTLRDVAMVFERFWILVFAGYFRASGPFERRGAMKQPELADVPGDLAAFVDVWTEILLALYAAEMSRKENEALARLAVRWRSLASQ